MSPCWLGPSPSPLCMRNGSYMCCPCIACWSIGADWARFGIATPTCGRACQHTRTCPQLRAVCQSICPPTDHIDAPAPLVAICRAQHSSAQHK